MTDLEAPPAYFSGTPFVVKRCILPSRRIGGRVPAALPMPGGW